jgi:hypothetical protein
MQFNHLIKTQDWSALDNRLHLPLIDGLISKNPQENNFLRVLFLFLFSILSPILHS